MFRLDRTTYVWMTAKTGSIIELPSPDWDGDDPSTHVWYRVRLTQDMVFQLEDELVGEVV